MKYSSVLNALKKFIASLLVAWFAVFSPALTIAQTNNTNEPVSIPVSIPVPVPTPTPSPTPTSSPTPAPVLKPDLIVLSASPSSQLTVGSKGEFNVAVKNTGNLEAKNIDPNKQIYITWNLKRLSDGNIMANSWNQVKKLAPNETAIVKFNYPYNFTQPGKYQIYGTVDDTNGVLESNESNNNYQANFEIADKLEISSIIPANPRQGDTVTIYGQGFVQNAASNLVYVGDALMATQFNTVSADGKRLTFVLSTEIPFRINSQYPVKIKTPNGPSLSNSLNITVTSPTILSSMNPTEAVAGENAILRGFNFGNIQGSVFLYDLNYKFVSTVNITSWGNNTIGIKIPAVETNKEYLMVVNGSFGSKFIYSSNPIKIKVLSNKADLVVLSATAVGDLKVGSYNNVDIVVKNQGKTSATSFWVSANTVDVKTLTQLGLCYAYVNKLTAGATATAQIRNCKPYKYEGQHMIYGKADEFNMVAEEIETNNTYVTYPSVTNPVLLPDLTVGLINVIGNHKVGQTDQVEVSVKNIGNKEVKLVSVGITMYDSKGNKVVNLGTSTRGYTIVPGGSDIARITLPQSYQYIGTHWFKIDLDYANSITESNENNNSQWTSVNVTNTVAPSISWSWPDILRPNYYLLLVGANFGKQNGEVIFIESKTGKEIGKAQPFYWSENYIYSYTPSSLKAGQQYGIYVKTADGKTTPIIWKTAGR